MATRLYLVATDAPPVSPTFDASWETTTSAVRRTLALTKYGPVQQEASALTATTNTPAGAVDRLLAQFVSAPLSANATISGAIKGQIMANESNAAADLRMQAVIWVRKADGTSRGTLIASNAGALASEWATSGTNRKIPLGGSTIPTSVNALTTDRIVVELGFRKHESATTSRTGTIQFGNPTGGTDFPEDETDTTGTKVPWIEFADNLTFTGAIERVTQDVIEVMGLPTDAVERITQHVVEVMGLPTDAIERVTQDVIEVMVTSPTYGAVGGERFYAYVVG